MGGRCIYEKLFVDTLVLNKDFSHQRKLYSCGKLKFSKYCFNYKGAIDFQWIHKAVFVGFRKTLVSIFSRTRNSLMSRNEMDLLFSVSYINCVDEWKLFNIEIRLLIESFLIKQIVSSTYLFQQARCSDKVWIKLFSNSTINIWPPCVKFSKMINICWNIWLIEIWKCQLYKFFK